MDFTQTLSDAPKLKHSSKQLENDNNRKIGNVNNKNPNIYSNNGFNYGESELERIARVYASDYSSSIENDNTAEEDDDLSQDGNNNNYSNNYNNNYKIDRNKGEPVSKQPVC